MKNKYLSNIIGLILLLIVSVIWLAYSPGYYQMGTQGLALLAFIVYQIISYILVFIIYAFMFIIEFIIYKTKLLKPRELNINNKFLIAISVILASPMLVIFLTMGLALCGDLTRQHSLPKYEYEVPVEKNTYYEEETNSNNEEYTSREVTTRVTPNGIERSERLTPNRNYHR